jgi:biopolymer transport protein ExbD
MSKFKLKKRKQAPASFEINVTPMIDMFSVLITFLLATAVFGSTGQTRIEVPFLSSKPPPPQEDLDKKPEKVLTLVVDTDKVKLEVSQTNGSAVVDKQEYKLDEPGLDSLQAKVYELRTQNPTLDKATIMTETDVKYENLIMTIGALRELKAGRQPIPLPEGIKPIAGVDEAALIPKIVLGNIIL